METSGIQTRSKRAMTGVEVVVHAAAALPLSRREDIFSTDGEGTRIVLEAAFSHDVSRVIFTSSTSVYGVPKHHPLLEEDRLQGLGPYGEAKIAAEKHCLCSAAQDTAFLCYGQKVSSDPRDWVCSNCSTTGLMKAGIFLCLDPETIFISSWMSKTCAKQSTFARPSTRLSSERYLQHRC